MAGKLLLTLDIGNTNILYGLFKESKLTMRGRIPTKAKSYLNYFRRLPLPEIEDAIISSVVPPALDKLEKICKKFLPKPPLVLGKNIEVPIVNLYKKPGQVGQDRLVNAYAGSLLYANKLIIVDFGTAVTFDIVSERGEYLGGMIFPGIKVSLNALCKSAALLPNKIKLYPESRIIGRSTEESIRSGIYNGFTSLFKGVINMIKEQIGADYKVIITGGDAAEIYPLLGKQITFDAHLTLKGLLLVYENNRY